MQHSGSGAHNNGHLSTTKMLHYLPPKPCPSIILNCSLGHATLQTLTVIVAVNYRAFLFPKLGMTKQCDKWVIGLTAVTNHEEKLKTEFSKESIIATKNNRSFFCG